MLKSIKKFFNKKKLDDSSFSYSVEVVLQNHFREEREEQIKIKKWEELKASSLLYCKLNNYSLYLFETPFTRYYCLGEPEVNGGLITITFFPDLRTKTIFKNFDDIYSWEEIKE